MEVGGEGVSCEIYTPVLLLGCVDLLLVYFSLLISATTKQ